MVKVLIVFYSRSGNTAKMAEAVMEGVEAVDGVTCEVKKVEETKPEDLLEPEGLLMGSPVYYGTMAAELKKLIDASVAFHGQLDGKVGGAFATSGVAGGGAETAVLDILKTMLVHGMIVKGNHQGAHYGPVCVKAPDDKALDRCRALGRDIAELTVKLHG